MTVISIGRARARLAPEPELYDEDTWRASASCTQTDPEAFFPESNFGVATQKRVCAACPVRPICLGDALQDSGFTVYGIWGGLTEGERRALTATDRDRIFAEAASMMVRDRAA